MDKHGNIIHYDWFVWVIAEIIKTHFMSRSTKEPYEMVRDDFMFFVQKDGLYAGCNAFLLKSNHNGQKNADITISNHTHRDRQDDRQYVPLYQVSDDPMDEYNLVYKFFHHVLPPNDRLIGGTRIFRYQASKKQINRIGAMAPILVPLFGVFFLGGHISLKNRTYRPLLRRSRSSFKDTCFFIYLIVLPFECNGCCVSP
jgi:hypothetical protein